MKNEWTLVGTNDLSYGRAKQTREQRLTRDRRFQQAIKNQPKLKLIELILKTEQSAENKKSYEQQLAEAYRKKKLKSKRLIKQAKALNKKVKTEAV